MVHSLAFSPSGSLLAGGCGDGTCRVFAIENRALVEVGRLQEESVETPIASVVFPAFLPVPDNSSSNQKISSQDRLVTTVQGNGCINFWDLGINVAGEGPHDPLNALGNMNGDTCGISEAMDGISLESDNPKMLFRIAHNQKPNWMASSRGMDPNFPSALFIADTSNDITAYKIPIR